MILPQYTDRAVALEGDLTHAHSLIDNWDIQAPDSATGIDATVAECEAALELARQHRDAMKNLLATAGAKRDHVTSAARGRCLNLIPPEFLRCIFEYAAEDDWSNRWAWTASHVDRKWRELALSLPRIWSHVFVGRASVAQLEAALARSKDHPLKVWISLHVTTRQPYDDNVDRFMVQLCSTSHRWILVKYRLYSKHDLLWERLQSINAINVEEVICEDTIRLPLQNSPKLRKLLVYSGLRHRLAANTTYDTLESLEAQLETVEDVAALSAFPNIRRATLSMFNFIPPYTAERSPHLTLPHLTNLRISDVKNAAVAATLFRILDFPQLKQLILNLSGPQDLTAFRNTNLHQIEKLTLSGNCNGKTSDRRIICRVSHLLKEMPNLRKLTLVGLVFDRDLVDWVKQMGHKKAFQKSPFLTQLRHLTLSNCNNVDLDALKEFLPKWTSIAQPSRDEELSLTIGGTSDISVALLDDAWSGTTHRRLDYSKEVRRADQFSDDED